MSDFITSVSRCCHGNNHHPSDPRNGAPDSGESIPRIKQSLGLLTVEQIWERAQCRNGLYRTPCPACPWQCRQWVLHALQGNRMSGIDRVNFADQEPLTQEELIRLLDELASDLQVALPQVQGNHAPGHPSRSGVSGEWGGYSRSCYRAFLLSCRPDRQGHQTNAQDRSRFYADLDSSWRIGQTAER